MIHKLTPYRFTSFLHVPDTALMRAAATLSEIEQIRAEDGQDAAERYHDTLMDTDHTVLELPALVSHTGKPIAFQRAGVIEIERASAGEFSGLWHIYCDEDAVRSFGSLATRNGLPPGVLIDFDAPQPVRGLRAEPGRYSLQAQVVPAQMRC